MLLVCLQEEQHIPISGITELNKRKSKDEIQIKLCDVLVEHLERRFPDLSLIRAFQLFDPQLLLSSQEIDTCGDEIIGEL